MSCAMFFNVSRPSDIISKPWSYIKKRWNVKQNGRNELIKNIIKKKWKLHACFVFLISYSFLNWLDSSVCWKYSSSNRPSMKCIYQQEVKYIELDKMLFDRSNETNRWPESNLICVRDAEAAQPPPDGLGAAAPPSGIAWILSGSARTKSLRAANSSGASPFTCYGINI